MSWRCGVRLSGRAVRRRLLASMLTTAGFRRSATSAKLTTPAMPGTNGRSSRAGRDTTGVAELAGLGDNEPVTTMPTRNDTEALRPTVNHANRLVIYLFHII